MIVRKPLRIIRARVFLLPDDIRNEVLFSKHFIKKLSQVRHFRVINRDKQEAVITQEVLCQIDARVHHREPFRVVSTG